MGVLQMAKLTTFFLISVILQGVTSKLCDYSPTYNTELTVSCIWGCCYKTIYPCCDPPLYATTEFIVLTAVGSFLATVGVVVAVICIVRRRRAAATQFGTVLAVPQVMAAPPGVTYAVHYSQQYPGVVYPAQPTNETTPMYSAQPYIGAPPTYPAQPHPSEATPMYSTQPFTDNRPAYEGPPPKQ